METMNCDAIGEQRKITDHLTDSNEIRKKIIKKTELVFVISAHLNNAANR